MNMVKSGIKSFPTTNIDRTHTHVRNIVAYGYEYTLPSIEVFNQNQFQHVHLTKSLKKRQHLSEGLHVESQ